MPAKFIAVAAAFILAISMALASQSQSAEPSAAVKATTSQDGQPLSHRCKNCPGPKPMGNMSSCNGPKAQMHGGPQHCPKMKN